MPAPNAELVRRLFAELGSGVSACEVETRLSDTALQEFFDPRIEWIPVAQSLLASDTYRGYVGVRRLWREFLSPWDDYVVELQELVHGGDQVAVVMRMAGRRGELEVDEIWSSLQTIRDGRIVRIQGFTTSDGARRAAGLGP